MSSGKFINALPGMIIACIVRMLHVLNAIRFDRVFIHRELAPAGPPIYEWIIVNIFRKKIIYDFDDAIWLTDDLNRQRFLSGMKWTSKIGMICRISYRVSCGNDYLRSFALKFNPESYLNPTTIDMQALKGKRRSHQSRKATIGWTGSHTTLKYLYGITNELKEVLTHREISLTVICNRKPDWDINNYTFIEWNRDTEVEDLLGFDIGLMPLSDDPWTRGKCGFKAMQYLALGIPALVSPLEVNRQIVDHDRNGYYCSTPADWIKYIIELANDPQKREVFGTSGIRKITDHYSAGSNFTNFLGLFE